MITLLLIQLIGLTYQQETLFYSAFTADTFSDPDGWVFYQGGPDIPIQYSTIPNGKTIVGGKTKMKSGSLYKYFYISTPHCEIRLRATVVFYKVSVVMDFFQIFLAQDPLTIMKIYDGGDTNPEQIVEIDVSIRQNSPSVPIIMNSLYTVDHSLAKEWGMRDFYLYIRLCPPGCMVCTKDEDSSVCAKWTHKQEYLTLTDPLLFTTEGWRLSEATAAVKKLTCRGVPLLGETKTGASFQKTIILPPHFRVRIQFMLQKIEEWLSSYVVLSIDNVDVKNVFVSDNPYFVDICGGMKNDGFQFADHALTHSNRVMKVLIKFSIPVIATTGTGGIRDIRIYAAPCRAGCLQCTTSSDCQLEATVPVFTSLHKSLDAATFAISQNWAYFKSQLGNQIYNCAGTNLIGGYDVLGQQQQVEKYFFLPKHRKIKIKINLFQIDNFQTEKIDLLVDSTVAFTKTFTSQILEKNQVCGNPAQSTWGDANELVEVELDHEKDGVLVQVQSNIVGTKTTKSFGIRDFYIYTGNCVETCVTCTASGACQTIYTLQKSMYTDPIFTNDYLWQIFDIIPLPIQTCSGKSILGGPGQFITPLHKAYRIVDIAATHTYIRIQMTIYLLDNWLNEIVTVTVDEKEVFKQMFHQSAFPSTLCGDGTFKDMTFELDEYVQHTSNRVKVEVTANIDSTATTKSWGIRDFELQYM